MALEVQEIINRLRLLSLLMQTSNPVDRDKKLRKEINTIFDQVSSSEKESLLRRLSTAFPAWPPDMPAPQPLTDAEMIDRLRMRMDHSEEDREGVQRELREREISCGLTTTDITKLRANVALDPEKDPEVGRVVDALLIALRTLSDIDRVFRLFLQNNEMGVLGLSIPRFKETIAQLLTRSDSDQLRHSDLERLNSSCSLLSRVATLLVQWPQSYAEKLARELAPTPIESIVPKKFMSSINFEACWNEYIKRVGGKDEQAVKAEFLEIFKRVLNETASS